MANRRKKAKEEAQDLLQQPSPKPGDDPLEPDDEGDERDEPLDQPAEHSEPYESSEEEDMEDSIIKQKSMELTPEQEQELAEFYEENPSFYDKSRSDFKNSKKKDRLLQEKAETMNLTVADIRLWYRSQRTILGKVKKKKSGQKRCNLTARQKWVERNLGFLRKHIVHRPQGSQLGQIPVDEEDKDSEHASVTQAPTKKKQRKNKDLDTAIIDLLEKSDRQTVDLTAKVDAAMSHGTDEKQAWVDWMLQALQPLTRHLWRDFTEEASTSTKTGRRVSSSSTLNHSPCNSLYDP